MGKIRVKALGLEEKEQEQRKRDVDRRVLKKAKKEGITVEKVKATTVPEKKTEKISPVTNEVKKSDTKQTKKISGKMPGKKEKIKGGPRKRSGRYTSLRSQVDRTKLYPTNEAIALVLTTATTKFTGKVEAHVNLKRKAVFKSTDAIKVERKFPLVHAVLGKTTDDREKLTQELDKLIKKVSLQNISKITLSSSMGPGIKVAFQ